MRNRKKNKRKAPRVVRDGQARAGGMASQTAGRARTFVNRKRLANRRACRGRVGVGS